MNIKEINFKILRQSGYLFVNQKYIFSVLYAVNHLYTTIILPEIFSVTALSLHKTAGLLNRCAFADINVFGV